MKHLTPCVDCGNLHDAHVRYGIPTRLRCRSCLHKSMKGHTVSKETRAKLLNRWKTRQCKRLTVLRFCECGCGCLARKRFINEHYHQAGITYEEKYGSERATALRERMSADSRKRYYANPNIREKLLIATSGKHPNMSQPRKEKWNDPEYRKKQAESHKKFYESDAGLAFRERDSKMVRDMTRAKWADPNSYFHTQEYRDKISNGRIGIPCWLKGKHQSAESKMSSSISHRRLWNNPDWVRERVKANKWQPNKVEKALSHIIRHVCPHMYRYNGDGRLGVVLGGKIPDFLNINGKKQVIELLGTYWHGETLTHRTKEQEEHRLLSHYGKLGFGCLLIWESELKNRDIVKSKLKEFAGV